MKVVWRHAALTSARRFMADQAGIRAVNQAVAASGPPVWREQHCRTAVGGTRGDGPLADDARANAADEELAERARAEGHD